MEARLGALEATVENHGREIRDIKDNHKEEIKDIKNSMNSLEKRLDDIIGLMRSIKYVLVGAALYAAVKEFGVLTVISTLL